VKQGVTLLLGMLALGGCWQKAPTQAVFSMTSYSFSPVLVTETNVEGLNIPPRPRVVSGQAEDTSEPRDLGVTLVYWSAGHKDTVAVTAEWVELLTDRAWQASLEVSPEDLLRDSRNAASITLVFGPNGLLVAGTDSSDPGPGKDLAHVCGTRVPAQDRDISVEVNKHAKLASTLSFDFPPVPDQTTCPEPQE